MAPPTTWIHVNPENLGKLQWMIDTAMCDPLDDPIVFAVKPGGKSAKSEALRLAIEKLKNDLDTERKELITEAKKFREAIGVYAVKLRQADDDSERGLISFEVRSDTPSTVQDPATS